MVKWLVLPTVDHLDLVRIILEAEFKSDYIVYGASLHWAFHYHTSIVSVG